MLDDQTWLADLRRLITSTAARRSPEGRTDES